MKPIRDLVDSDIINMSEETFLQYEKDSGGLIDMWKMAVKAKKQKFHELATVMKQRGLDYKTYQIEAYNVRKEYQTLVGQIVREEGYVVRLRRDWNRFHNKNQVFRWTKTEDGRDVLSL